jgi:hypothetical protein
MVATSSFTVHDPAARRADGHHLLARHPVRHVLVDLRPRVTDELAVAGRDRLDPHGSEAIELREVGAHVAVGRGDDHRGPLHDVVTREQQPLLLQPEAEVVRRVAGGVERGEPELGPLEHVAVRHRAVDGERVPAVEAEHLGAGALLQAGRPGRVVAVGVRAEDPPDPVATAAGDGVEVRRVVGPGIDDGDLVDADEVGVGPGAGHHPRVGRDDPPHHRAEGACNPGDELGQRGLGIDGHGKDS